MSNLRVVLRKIKYRYPVLARSLVLQVNAALNKLLAVCVQPGPMGCGASKPDSSGGVEQLSPSMLCDLCQNKFSLITRKVTDETFNYCIISRIRVILSI